MTFGVLLHRFFEDDKVVVIFVALALDFALGVIAALKVGNFRLSYVADFLRNDIAFKVVPYFVLYAGALVAGGQDILIPGIDMGVLAGAAYVTVIGALVGSILKSVADLGFQPSGTQTTRTALTGAENAAPPKD